MCTAATSKLMLAPTRAGRLSRSLSTIQRALFVRIPLGRDDGVAAHTVFTRLMAEDVPVTDAGSVLLVSRPTCVGYNRDFYEDLVGDDPGCVQLSVLTHTHYETPRGRLRNKFDSTKSVHDVAAVLFEPGDPDETNLYCGGLGQQFHAKIAIPFHHEAGAFLNSLSCFGDLNRDFTQTERGGGLLCIFDAKLRMTLLTMMAVVRVKCPVPGATTTFMKGLGAGGFSCEHEVPNRAAFRDAKTNPVASSQAVQLSCPASVSPSGQGLVYSTGFPDKLDAEACNGSPCLTPTRWADSHPAPLLPTQHGHLRVSKSCARRQSSAPSLSMCIFETWPSTGAPSL